MISINLEESDADFMKVWVFLCERKLVRFTRRGDFQAIAASEVINEAIARFRTVNPNVESGNSTPAQPENRGKYE
jgi:hypothetical protein